MAPRSESESGHDIDVAHWGRMARWELEEAVALALGRDPDTVSFEELKNDTGSEFGKEFAKAFRLARRARERAVYFYPIIPRDFVEWAKTVEFPFPEDLAAEVIKASPNQINYRPKYEALLPQHEAALKEIERLKTQTSGPPQEKGLSTKERQTALKLIIGMAINGYAFDPNASRSGTAAEIASDLHKLGLSIDEDTARNWLKEAAEMLPGGKNPQED